MTVKNPTYIQDSAWIKPVLIKFFRFLKIQGKAHSKKYPADHLIDKTKYNKT